MTGMKPNVDMIMQRKVSGDSDAHVAWSAAKKQAARAGADLSLLPKDNLGPLLDNFRQYVRGAGELSRLNVDPSDNKAVKPLKETAAKIRTAVSNYLVVVDNQIKAPGATPAVKKAWQDLRTALVTAQAYPKGLVNQMNIQLRKENPKFLPLKPDLIKP
jgi:hypothetical protein